MTDNARPRWRWWKAHELRINIVLLLASLFIMSVGLVLGVGPMVGLSLLLVIFFGTYTVYAYVRRDL